MRIGGRNDNFVNQNDKCMAEWQLIASPTSWRELQDEVGLILSDCGYNTEIEKEISLGRGKSVVDVYARRSCGIPTTIICECKHWNKKVPRSVVQGFRTIILESGANLGYIISAKGFQSGSYEVATKTNIHLLSWAEFQEAFRTDWLKNMIGKIQRAGSELRSFIMYINTKGAGIDGKSAQLEQIRVQHEDWIFFSLRDHYTNFNTTEISWKETINTIENRAARYLPLKPEFLRDYFQAIYDHLHEEIGKIEALYDGRLKWDPDKMLPGIEYKLLGHY